MKRLNVKLALWLVGITVFSVVGVHFLHGFQVDRNAEILKVQAEQAAKEGDAQEAIKQYNQYLRHRDDPEGYRALAKLVVAEADASDATPQERIRAYNILEEAIRRHPELDEVRESLVDYTMMFRRFGDALDHIAQLKANGNTNPELEYKAAKCLFFDGEEDDAKQKLHAMLGYDDDAGTFAEEAPESAKEVDAFVLLAHILRKNDQATQAEEVLKQMVTWNPDSAEAHLALARDTLGMWSRARTDTAEGKDLKEQLFAESKASLDRAYELDPDNADVMLLTAATMMLEQNLAEAQVVLDRALEKHPERSDVYLRRSELAMAQQNVEQAAKELQAGLEKAANKVPLLQQLVEVQLQLKDLKGAQATCDEMRKVESIPIELVRYQDARIQLLQGDVLNATRELEQVRPAMERLGPQYVNSINVLLGRCYEALGMSDRQLEVYRRLLASYPGMTSARIGEASALQALGRHSEAATSVQLLAQMTNQIDGQLRPTILQLVLNQEMTKPEAERDWQRVNSVASLIYQDDSYPELRKQLLKSDLLVAQGKTEEALQLLSGLRKEHPKEVGVWTALSRLMTSDEKYRDRVPQLLSLAEKETGSASALQAERIKLVARNRGEQASGELRKLEEQLGQYKEQEQEVLRNLLAASYLQVGDYENGVRSLKALLAERPENARGRQLLFELALERSDFDQMQVMVDELRESRAFGRESALYKYCAAAMEMMKFNEKRKGKTEPLTPAEQNQLAEIKKLVDDGLAIRSEWSSLWRVKGEVSQLQGDIDDAIDSYQRSLDYSRSNQGTTARRLVTLLSARQRYAEANEAMKYLSSGDMPDEMRRLVEFTKIKGGNTEEALAMAKADIEKDPQNPQGQLWYGQLLEGSGDTDAAVEAYRQATQLDPKLTPAWELLVRRLMANGKNDEALAVVREADKSLVDVPLAMARLYQRVGQMEKAEQLYQEALAQKPGDLNVLRHLAEFKLATNEIQDATSYLDKIINVSAKGGNPADATQVAWARNRKARISAASRDYTSTMDAVKLIEQNATSGELSREDIQTIVALLAPRVDEPQSRAKAIKLMEQLRKTDGLSPPQMVALARLYERDGDWPTARGLMVSSIASDSDNAQSLLLFAELLLGHDEVDDAQRYVERADNVVSGASKSVTDPLAQAVRTLNARILVHNGQKEEAAKVLEESIPRPLPQDQLALLLRVAQQMEALELFDAAEQTYEEFASLDPGRGPIAMAAFYGRRGDLERSFGLLEQARQSQPMIEILPVALANLRNFPEKISEQHAKTIDEWGVAALEQSKDPQRIKLLLAELYDLQGRYDDVVRIYREVLADPKATEVHRAIVQNNLAFILSAVNPTPAKGAEAEKLIEDSIRILGPTSDLLDTRALTYLAQGKVEQAAADVRQAVGDRPTTSKYYHLAQIEKKLGNDDAARQAIEKAQELHGEHNPFTPAEREGYQRLKKSLDVTTQAGT